MRKFAIPALALLLPLLDMTAAAAQSKIILNVAARERASYKGHCQSAEFGPEFINNVDFNNDGLSDIIVDHGAVTCDGKKGTACRDIGCPYNFYIQVAEGGYLFAANADLFGYSLMKRYGNMVLVLKADGVSCKKEVGEPCTITIRVRNTTFETISKR